MKGYSDRQAKNAAKDKAHAQAFIARDFAEQIEAAKARLCLAGCIHHESACSFGLLPLDTKGDDCPYYERSSPYHL